MPSSVELQSSNLHQKVDSVNAPHPSKKIDGRSYQKVKVTGCEGFRNAILTIFTLGIYLAVQNHRFKKALVNGDLEKAVHSIHWGAEPAKCLEEKDIQKLIDAGQIESLKFVDAQIDYARAHIYFGKQVEVEKVSYIYIGPELSELQKVHNLLQSVPEIRQKMEKDQAVQQIRYDLDTLKSGRDLWRESFVSRRIPPAEQVSPHLNIIIPDRATAG